LCFAPEPIRDDRDGIATNLPGRDDTFIDAASAAAQSMMHLARSGEVASRCGRARQRAWRRSAEIR
jgi:hypothetical protein